jgi:lipopolysaccharide/colanic/teichoic acid biosynthesis glycosyltransferase
MRHAGSSSTEITKRAFDVALASVALVATLPILLPAMFLTWCYDRQSPFYVAPRVARGGGLFDMVKLRSMIVGADRTGVDSTSGRDRRITPIGHVIRRFKLDEVPQLWNVLKGDMSLVGPRPQVPREAQLYTPIERRMLDVRPGVTDFASIVFGDLAEILRDVRDPDVAYHQLVRPGKSRLALFYIGHRSLWLDAQLVALTALAVVSRPLALRGVQRLLRRLGAGAELVELAGRSHPLVPSVPPGADRIVTTRDVNRFA